MFQAPVSVVLWHKRKNNWVAQMSNSIPHTQLDHINRKSNEKNILLSCDLLWKRHHNEP